ncbi:hypothetical protein HTG_17465 [Natrinema mahii]|nr:hypothetical protein HTG_17465 [Natrinema mahii]
MAIAIGWALLSLRSRTTSEIFGCIRRRPRCRNDRSTIILRITSSMRRVSRQCAIYLQTARHRFGGLGVDTKTVASDCYQTYHILYKKDDILFLKVVRSRKTATVRTTDYGSIVLGEGQTAKRGRSQTWQRSAGIFARSASQSLRRRSHQSLGWAESNVDGEYRRPQSAFGSVTPKTAPSGSLSSTWIAPPYWSTSVCTR